MVGPRLSLVWNGSARSGESPFDALLRASEEEPDAAAGLALGYAALAREEREALLATMIGDARAAGRSPAGPLALLLAVEEDRTLARTIAAALADAGSEGLAHERDDSGWGWGGSRDGGVAIARHLHGAFIEVLCLSWQGGALSPLRVEPLARRERVDEVRRRLGVPDAAEALALDEAIDRLAERLWRARLAHGALPEGLRALARLFAPY